MSLSTPSRLDLKRVTSKWSCGDPASSLRGCTRSKIDTLTGEGFTIQIFGRSGKGSWEEAGSEGGRREEVG